jgi:two-component system response regulator YesN
MAVPWGAAAALLFVPDRLRVSPEDVSARILEVLAGRRMQGAVVCAPRATGAVELARSIVSAEEGIEESLLSGSGRVIWRDAETPPEPSPSAPGERERSTGAEMAAAKALVMDGLTEGRGDLVSAGRERAAVLLARAALTDVDLGKLLLLSLLGDAAGRLLDLGCERTALRAWARRQMLGLMAPNTPTGLHSILVQAIEGAWGLRSAATDPHAVILQGALDYIQIHFEDVTLERVAEAVHVSPSHLSRLFSRVLRKRFVDVVKEVRMGRAKELLVGGASVRDAALAVGYGNLAYFSTAFKETVGETPSEYRRRRSA